MDEELLFIDARENGERIDALLSNTVSDYSRNAIQRIIETGNVLLDGKPVKKSHKCTIGETYEILLPILSDSPLLPQDIPLDILYEDDCLLVVNKARGMVVHPAPGHPDGTLVNALLYHCGDTLSGIGGEKRPGIVHRIDMDTSGLLIVAKNDLAHNFLSSQLSDRSLSRQYIAIVHNNFKELSGTIDKPIGRCTSDRKKMAVTTVNSKPAITHWEVIRQYKGYSYITCKLETGRTHQIRVHMAYSGHVLLGDSLYGAKVPDKGLTGQCLHAKKIKFIHPLTKQEMSFETDIPDYFMETLNRLEVKGD